MKVGSRTSSLLCALWRHNRQDEDLSPQSSVPCHLCKTTPVATRPQSSMGKNVSGGGFWNRPRVWKTTRSWLMNQGISRMVETLEDARHALWGYHGAVDPCTGTRSCRYYLQLRKCGHTYDGSLERMKRHPHPRNGRRESSHDSPGTEHRVHGVRHGGCGGRRNHAGQGPTMHLKVIARMTTYPHWPGNGMEP